MMATSAMGPGFLTQTAVFTVKLGAAFGFAILVSILIDYVVQQNIWRVVTLTQMRASDIANKALPGSGYLLAFLVILGGFFFSVGNIAGAALGLNALFGLDTKWGGILSGALAILIFASRKATLAMDKSMIVLGLLKILPDYYRCCHCDASCRASCTSNFCARSDRLCHYYHHCWRYGWWLYLLRGSTPFTR